MAHFTIQRTIRVFLLMPLLLACLIESSRTSFARAEEPDQISPDVSDVFPSIYFFAVADIFMSCICPRLLVFQPFFLRIGDNRT
jgi:hypothetical protein